MKLFISTYGVRTIFYLSAFCPILSVDLAILIFLSAGYYIYLFTFINLINDKCISIYFVGL